MAQNSDSYHEPYDILQPETRDMHRAVVSAMEELEAIDWYQQRADACQDEELRRILLHNKDEEMEHALMTLEWIRRHSATFSENAETYLFTEGPIEEIEEKDHEHEPASPGDGSLNLGSLKDSKE